MQKISKIVLFVILIVLAAGAVFLATWDIPAPVATIEKVIPDERFPH